MAITIYSLCTLTSVLCAGMLLRGYLKSRYRLLLWSGLCFVGLTLNNILVIMDNIVFPDVDLSPLRNLVALLAVLPLLYGFIFDE